MSGPRRIRWFVWGLAAAVIGGGPALPRLAAEDPIRGGPADDPAGLVRQLGDESFQRREAATLRLARLGLEAKAALIQGLDSPDAEVRRRCQRILADVLELDFRQRVRRFAEATDEVSDGDVPGWKSFHQIVGDGKSARDLYVEMLGAEPELLETLASDAERLPELLTMRLRQVQARRSSMAGSAQSRDVGLGSIATFLFVLADEKVLLPEPVLNQVKEHVYSPAFQQAIMAGPKAEPTHRLLAAWLRRDELPPLETMKLAFRHQIPEALPTALKVIAQQQGVPMLRVQALLLVARFGTLAQVPAVEPLLQDVNGVNYRVQSTQGTTEVRDIALAVLVKLSGQKYAEYGLAKVVEHPQLGFETASVGFPDEEARARAQQKWADWSREHAAEIQAAQTDDVNAGAGRGG
ncbi:MAG: hypothetical protein K1X74_20270 [Pirellulales bacterium]|nr:hypothetical protein [Pirellulales bacterium]